LAQKRERLIDVRDLKFHELCCWLFQPFCHVPACFFDGERMFERSITGSNPHKGKNYGTAKPDQFRPLAVPVGFPVVNEGYLQNPGVWLSLRGGGLALYTASSGVRIMTRQTDIFDVAGGCW